ncbi:MAG: bifunctional [glutamate--ammonia ligase]-adenylyl-L-tyrosine phosphorylase/[glutamate--ammonia-ligase] adenylyltransferase, partial [Psychromonas sp.]
MTLLTEIADKHFQQLNERVDLSFLSEAQTTQLHKLCALSDFVAESLIKQPSLIEMLFCGDLLLSEDRKAVIQSELRTQLAAAQTESELHQILRLFRRKHMVVIAWRELLRESTLQESLE